MAHRRPQGSAEFIRDRRGRPPPSLRCAGCSHGAGRCACDPTDRALSYQFPSTTSFVKIVAPRLTKYLLPLRSAGERLALL